MTNRIPASDVQLALSGQLMVATKRCEDGLFAGTVCLILHHGQEGSMGLVLNKSLDIDVGGLLKFLEASDNSHHRSVCFGGPVSGPIIALHNHAECAEVAAASGVYVAAHLDKLKQLVSSDDGEVRILVGQVHWKVGQLEQEMSQGLWLPLPATPKIVFANPEDMWQQSMRELGNRYISLLTHATPPADVHSN